MEQDIILVRDYECIDRNKKDQTLEAADVMIQRQGNTVWITQGKAKTVQTEIYYMAHMCPNRTLCKIFYYTCLEIIIGIYIIVLVVNCAIY